MILLEATQDEGFPFGVSLRKEKKAFPKKKRWAYPLDDSWQTRRNIVPADWATATSSKHFQNGTLTSAEPIYIRYREHQLNS